MNEITVITYLEQAGIYAALVSLLLAIVISILGVVPSVFLSSANAIVYGLPMGFAISLVGEVLGAFVSYWLYRKGIMSIKGKPRSTDRWSALFIHASPSKQFSMMFVARMLPFLPSGVITFAAAWTKMKVTIFMLATTLGKAPSVAAEVWVGESLFYYIRNLF